LPHIPAAGGGQTLLAQTVPVLHVAPLAMQLRVPGSQQPAPHAPPGQHGSPGPPHCAHTPSEHARPEAEQLSPAQQIWPGPPHCSQVPLPQARPAAVQVRPEQQGWPGPPHAAHCPAAQLAPLAVQVARPGGIVSLQQLWPTAPQLPQLPLLQLPPTLGQVDPEPVHRPATQQPPPLQALPSQQDWPAPPHGAQTSLLLHAEPDWQMAPAQQVWPGAPHCSQVPPAQVPPALQERSGQQAEPSDPQLVLKATVLLA
jgi:hypothetical protein